MTLIAPGTCRHCDCTEANACRLPEGDTCAWVNPERTVCSNPACIKAEKARMARARAEAPRPPRRLNRFDIWEQQAERRREKRRQARLKKKGRAA
jgi:hypothetical protein